MDFNLHTLNDAFAEIDKHCQKHHLPETECYNIRLVCEELIVNLLKHTTATSYHLNLSQENGLTLIRIGYQANEFNPSVVPEKKNKPVEEMEYGGLGLLLVNSLAKKIHYHYDPKQSLNVIQITL